MRIRVIALGAVLVVALPFVPALAADASRDVFPVGGKWYNAGPCTPVAVVPDAKHPLYADVTCVGSSVWTGTWLGVTDFTVTGRVNLVTSATTGTLVEVFVGKAGSRRGTMRFRETIRVDGTTRALRIVADLVSGTGGFARARAHVVFTGIITLATNGYGTYSGTWSPG
jgi:hypothetical protein